MRRTLALLSLLAFTWPHVAARECALAASRPMDPGAVHEHAPTGHAPRGHASHDHSGLRHGRLPVPGPQEAGARQLPEDDGEPTTSCVLVMACGLVMLVGESSFADARPGAPTVAAGLFAARTPEGERPLADPPPPRRLA